MKQILIRAYLTGKKDKDKGEVIIDTNTHASTMAESFELIGIYEFFKKEKGNEFASVLLLKIDYDDKVLGIRHRTLKSKNSFFLVEDAMNKLIDDEMKNIKHRLQIKKDLKDVSNSQGV